uniref:Switch-associated protein 70-like isoform X2 n=1 Tax=Rhizophora mucronata TaxID=61149 RepID=A0A2P2JJ46_RHIMU
MALLRSSRERWIQTIVWRGSSGS